MTNLANALKEEIGRIARKEIRLQTAETAKSITRGERDIAALKRQIENLQNQLSSLRPQGAPKPAASKAGASRKTAAKKQGAKPAAASASDKQAPRVRFSAKSLKVNRERLGLSADNYGKLVGVSGLSIYNWEQEKARPRAANIAALMAVRDIGKREAAKRLEALAKPNAKAEKADQSGKKQKAADEG